MIAYFDVNCETGNIIQFSLEIGKDVIVDWEDGSIETISVNDPSFIHIYNTVDRNVFHIRMYGEKDAMKTFIKQASSDEAILQVNVFFDCNTLTMINFTISEYKIDKMDLSNCPRLMHLFYEGDPYNKHQLTVIPPQGDNSDLFFIRIYFTESLNISPLANLPNLRMLDLDNVGLKEFDLSNLPALNGLSLHSNEELEKIYFAPNSELASLILFNCKNLKEIDVTNCLHLKHFVIRNSGIGRIIQSYNSRISTLLASGSNLSELDLSLWPNLRELELNGTLISGLDFSTNSNISYIYIQDTPLNENVETLLQMAHSLPNRTYGNLYVDPGSISYIEPICTPKGWIINR